MFLHYPFIRAEHHVPLEAAIRKWWPGQETKLAALYQVALAKLDGTTPIKSVGILTSLLRDPQVTVSVATDEEFGVYVQLARVGTESRLLLTCGQKWTTENPTTTLGNIPTKIW